MPRSYDRFTTAWFGDRVAKANAAGARGKQQSVEFLCDLAEQCHRDARSGPSEWHEIQAWLLGSLLEEMGRHAEAAGEYGRIARLRRAQLAESSHGLGDAAAAAALCEFKRGNPRSGLKLALEALRVHSSHPLPGKTADLLQAEIEKAQRNNAGARRRRSRTRMTVSSKRS